ncbi:MAG: molybdopterin-guanine dinucleotide biosynthesis protein A [Rhodospirillales bacterium]
MKKFILVLLLAIAPLTAGNAADRHAGYYYPEPDRIETYISRAQTIEGVNRRQRIGFVVGFTQAILSRPYPPPYAIFVKGDDAEKLLIVGYQDGHLNTIYRVRALLAQLTSTARTMPVFQKFEVDDIFTYLDLLKMMGFAQITVSDGDAFAHQILIQ